MTPTGQIEGPGHPAYALGVAGVQNDWPDYRLRREPLRHEIAISRVWLAWVDFEIVIERDQGCRLQKGAGFSNHLMCVSPETKL